MSSVGKLVILHVLLLNVGFTFGTCPNGQFLNHSGMCAECSPCRGPDAVVIKRCHARNDTICGKRADVQNKIKKDAVPFESLQTWKFMLHPGNKSIQKNDAVKVRTIKHKPRKNESLIDKDGSLELSGSKISLDKNGKHIKKDLSSIDETVTNSNQSSLQSISRRKSVEGSKSSFKKNKVKQKKNENSGHSEEIEIQQKLAHILPSETNQFLVSKKEGKKPEKKTSSVELSFSEGSFGMKKTIATVLQAASHLKNRTKFFEPINNEYDVFKKNNIDEDDDDDDDIDDDDDDDDIEEDDDSKNSEYDDNEEDDDEDDDDDDEEDDIDEDDEEESDKPKLKPKPLKGVTYDELVQSIIPEKSKLKSKPLQELTYDELVQPIIPEKSKLKSKPFEGLTYDELIQSLYPEKPVLSSKPLGADQDFPLIVENTNDIGPETLVTQENKWPVVNEVNIEPFVDVSNWQLLILVAAITAGLLFFMVVNAYVCIYLRRWKHMKQNFEADVEDQSVRKNLMQHASFEVDETVYIKNYLTQLKGGKGLEK